MARILLVDDDKLARALYGDFLTGAGHQVDAVASSAAALAALEQDAHDVVVADLILPESDGQQLLEQVKARHPDTEVVIITALDKVEPAVRAIRSGATDYLIKPVEPEALAAAVSRALSQQSALRVNAELRRHVTLLEAGQRIAATIERARIVEIAHGAFQVHCGSAATAIFTRDAQDGTALSLLGEAALPEGLAAALGAALADSPFESTPGAFTLSGARLPRGFTTALVVPAREGEHVVGAAVLVFSHPVAGGAPDAATYLGHHLALALRNFGRYSAVEDLVYLDDLTHLFNRRYLELVLDKAVKQATPETKPFALLFLDLDYFKSINDTHGHLTGSKTLVEVARVLKGCVRDNDVLCRWGGDEYVVLLRGTDSGGALKVAERIRRSVEAHRFLAREGFGLHLTTCIGVAAFPEHAQDVETLVDFADRAMYRGKKSTRNIIYLASKGLEATPADRQAKPPQSSPSGVAAAPSGPAKLPAEPDRETTDPMAQGLSPAGSTGPKTT